MSAGVGSVAAPDFAIHDRRTDGLLGAVVRGFDIRETEEGEELGGVAFQVFGEAFVIGIGSAEAGQHAQLGREFVRQFAQPSTSLFPFPEFVASGQSVLEQLDHGAWEDHGTARSPPEGSEGNPHTVPRQNRSPFVCRRAGAVV